VSRRPRTDGAAVTTPRHRARSFDLLNKCAVPSIAYGTYANGAPTLSYPRPVFRKARHPPVELMSCAPRRAWDSHRNPFTQLPSSSSIDPIPSGDGMEATNVPNPSAGRPQTSNSIADPDSHAFTPGLSPGLGGVVFARAKKRYLGAVRHVRSSRPPRSVNWWFSGLTREMRAKQPRYQFRPAARQSESTHRPESDDPVAPSGSPPSRAEGCRRPATALSFQPPPARPSVTPAGSPPRSKPGWQR